KKTPEELLQAFASFINASADQLGAYLFQGARIEASRPINDEVLNENPRILVGAIVGSTTCPQAARRKSQKNARNGAKHGIQDMLVSVTRCILVPTARFWAWLAIKSAYHSLSRHAQRRWLVISNRRIPVATATLIESQ